MAAGAEALRRAVRGGEAAREHGLLIHHAGRARRVDAQQIRVRNFDRGDSFVTGIREINLHCAALERAVVPFYRRCSQATQSMLEKNASMYFGLSAGL